MDFLFGLDRVAPHDEGLTCVGTYYDNVGLAIAISLLEEASIPYQKKDRGVGGAMRVISGVNPYGADLFVSEADAELALQLLAPVSDAEENGEVLPSLPDEEDAE